MSTCTSIRTYYPLSGVLWATGAPLAVSEASAVYCGRREEAEQ